MNKKEIIHILNSDVYYENGLPQNDVLSTANGVREKQVGSDVHLRGLIEYTNCCRCNCLYCGIRSSNKNIKRYTLSKEEIISYTQNAINLGFKTIVLQGGENSCYTTEEICEIVKEIKKFDVALTLSIGERAYEDYKAFKNAGADRYLLRIETTDRELYKKMHPNADFENRIKCLEYLKELNYEVGTGSIVGLPYQTIESIAADLLFFKEINADMIGVGPFIPSFNTPLQNEQSGSFELALKTMAICRILLPKINIPATTAMETLKENGRIIALNSGANVVMPNIVDYQINQKYSIYNNKVSNKNGIEENLNIIKNQIYSINRTISNDFGNSLNH